MKSALVLFAHGSSDPEWATPFRTIQQSVASRKPEIQVELAFLERMRPSLDEAVDRLADAGTHQITIAPLFMAQGAHLKRDLAHIASELRRRHSRIEFKVLPAAGEVAAIVDALSTWLTKSV